MPKMKIKLKTLTAAAFLSAAIAVPVVRAEEPAEPPPLTEAGLQAVESIRQEALRHPADPVGHPLPLAATWAPLGHNFSPDYQLALIQRGHHLLLCFGWPYLDTQWGGENSHLPRYRQMRLDNFEKYFEPALKEAARLKLPISFQRPQFEMHLTSFYGGEVGKDYFSLPPEENPNVIGLDGKVQRMVDPLGPIEHWYELGGKLVDSEVFRLVEEAYPDPPLVIFLSNNEHPVLSPNDAEKSKRYVDQYGTGRSIEFRRRLFGDELAKRYRALQEGMRDGLTQPAWKENVKFVAYEAFGPSHLGRWGGWSAHSVYLEGRPSYHHLAWDGGSPSYYTHDWSSFLTDYTSSSMQTEAMNWVFMLEDVRKENPAFWFELSTWDGDQYTRGKRSQYAERGGQIYTADRYQGMLQFGLWLLRPRALRDFRYLESLAYAERYFLANVKAVDQVYASPLLQRFWRKGELVPNRDRSHPYNVALTDELRLKDRWFALTTNLENPSQNWGLYTEIPVFALALVLGEEPTREWLVFAHAPRGARTDVSVSLPGFGDIELDASVTGCFYHVKEQEASVERVIAGGPLSALAEVSTNRPQVGETVSFKAGNIFDPAGGQVSLEWDFADGNSAKGAEVAHAFQEKDQYFVKLTARNERGETDAQYEPISVGYPDMDGCLVHLPLQKTPDIAVRMERPQGAGVWIDESHKVVFAANNADLNALAFECEWEHDGERGDVLRLTGDTSYVRLNAFHDNTLNPAIPQYDALGRNRTVAFWFKADDVERRQVIFLDGNGNSQVINVYVDGGKLYAGAWYNNRDDHAGEWVSEQVENGKWYHAAIVLRDAEPQTAGTLTLYLNGLPVGSARAYMLRPASPRIGGNWSTRFHDGTSVEAKDCTALNGCVDNLAVFYRALSAEEIRDVMEQD